MPAPYALIPLQPTEPTDLLDHLPWDMIVMHNVFIRGVNSMYAKARLVKERDVPAFVGYCLSGIQTIDMHHKLEEAHIFPYLATGIDMKENVESHHALEQGLIGLKSYLESVQSGATKYDGARICSLLDVFSDGFIQHLRDEIRTISKEETSKLDRAGMQKMLDEHHAALSKVPNTLKTVFPWTFMHHDVPTAPTWPPIPGFLKLLAWYILPWFNRSFWKFCPYQFPSGKPQTYRGV